MSLSKPNSAPSQLDRREIVYSPTRFSAIVISGYCSCNSCRAADLSPVIAEAVGAAGGGVVWLDFVDEPGDVGRLNSRGAFVMEGEWLPARGSTITSPSARGEGLAPP